MLSLLVIGNVESAYRRVCYHTNWSQYRTSTGKFMPTDIGPDICTHLIYSFAKLQGNKLHSFEWNDESTPWMKGMYAKFNELKTQNPNLKTLIAVGGWTLGSKPFSHMSATDASRREFARTSVAFLRNHDFDGLDIDWEYPAKRSGSTTADRSNYIKLLKTLKQEFDAETKTTGKPKLILSAAVPAGKSNIDSGYNIPEMVKYLDMVNLMTYDLHGSWETKTGHNSGLFKHTGETGDAAFLNLDWVANYLVKGGMPASMINVGLAMYGRGFTLRNPGSHGLESPSRSPSDAGPFTGEKGFMAYYEICELLKTGGTRHYLADQMVPYVVKGSQWIGYEDVDSIRTKVKYIKQHGFGGTMIWALDLDDFHGNCGQGKFPLINAINDELKRSGGPVIQPVQQYTPLVNSQTTTQHVTKTSTTLKPKVINTTKGVHSTRQLGVPTTFSCKGVRDGFYPNPSSCDSYYICASGSPFLAHCASGLQYNSKTRYCDWPRNANCTNPSQPNQPSQTGTSTSPLNTNGPTKLLVFSNAPNTNTPSQTPANTNSPTKLLVFTNGPSKTNLPTSNPVGTHMPTKLLVFTPAPTNAPTYVPAPTSTPSPIQTNAPTKLLVFTNAPAFTNAPVQTNAPTQSPTNAPVTSSPNFNANFCRSKADGLYRDASDCGSYYQCSFGVTFHEPCSPGTAFNPQQDACDYPFNVPACMNYRG
ncbi:E3.2.1.14 [Mytilus coruscus]|uniref:E3.2.1.14 n=1 Tax=Mytilus coruscus TaxID=42192 RepID=A0A6J8EAX4_MYTCO|nr:E3.2.1.14 [Mytilus coruscus]